MMLPHSRGYGNRLLNMTKPVLLKKAEVLVLPYLKPYYHTIKKASRGSAKIKPSSVCKQTKNALKIL